MAEQGLFDTRSQEQILNDRWRGQHDARMEQINRQRYFSPAEQTAAQMGGLLASGIGKRFAPPTLTPDEQRQVEAIEAIKTRTDTFRRSNPNASVEDLGL